MRPPAEQSQASGSSRTRLLVAGAVAAMVVAGAAAALRLTSRPDERLLRFAPPELDDPITIQISDDNANLRLDEGRDYVIQMPDHPLDVEGGLQLEGGDDIVLIGGEIHHGEWHEGDLKKTNRALYLVDQTGTVHIEGLLMSGNLAEGIDLSQSRGARVQLENIRIETVTGSRSSNHADLLQTWAGPDELLVDGFVGSTTYQGLFLIPNQHFEGPVPSRIALHDVVLTGATGSRYLLWMDSPTPVSMVVDDVWVSLPGNRAQDRASALWWAAPPPDAWDSVEFGTAPQRLREGPDRAGVGYVSPGYR